MHVACLYCLCMYKALLREFSCTCFFATGKCRSHHTTACAFLWQACCDGLVQTCLPCVMQSGGDNTNAASPGTSRLSGQSPCSHQESFGSHSSRTCTCAATEQTQAATTPPQAEKVKIRGSDDAKLRCGVLSMKATPFTYLAHR